MDHRDTPGWEGSMGPFRAQYSTPHVYARDIHSGAGNCVCGAGLGERVHVQAAPGVPIPERMRSRVHPPAYRVAPEGTLLQLITAYTVLVEELREGHADAGRMEQIEDLIDAALSDLGVRWTDAGPAFHPLHEHVVEQQGVPHPGL